MIFTDPGYSLCWDNVALESKARYSGMDKGNKRLLFANAYGVRVRVRPIASDVVQTSMVDCYTVCFRPNFIAQVEARY